MDRSVQESMKTDTTEKGLESLIMRHMTGTDEGGLSIRIEQRIAPYDQIRLENTILMPE